MSRDRESTLATDHAQEIMLARIAELEAQQKRSRFSISRVISLLLVIMVIVGLFFPPLLVLALVGLFGWLALLSCIWGFRKLAG